ncbi:MAG: hypothetical protein J6D27_02245 [Ruminiclostridium sp.]|nr:hypothetical protein [Ruminiclostridium sp.]MBQ8791324.1 hypothetical protein [Ruminiclostridium sp.]
MRRHNNNCGKLAALILAVAGGIICITHFSAEVLLVLFAVLLMGIGLWLLIC